MTKKKLLFFLIFFLMIAYFFHLKSKKEVQSTKESIELNEEVKNSNIIKDIRHVSKDMEGNEYIIEAVQGEIDLTNSEIMFLENVTATIKPIDTSHIIITSDFGKYNIQTYDSNFSKNVIINYLNNKITAEYLDFSINNNLMTISENVIYTNDENILKADIAEMDIKTKDTKIFMYEDYKKVNIQSKNYSGYNKKISN
jgi:lipopolysaccharide assembly outer membrane protein LptD (OstA)